MMDISTAITLTTAERSTKISTELPSLFLALGGHAVTERKEKSQHMYTHLQE